MAKFSVADLFTKKDKKTDPKYAFNDYQHLLAIKPHEGYVFYSDYFRVDTYYATILSFFHRRGSDDGFPAFWGINMIPTGMDHDIVTVNLTQVKSMPESWVAVHQETSEKVADRTDRASKNNSNSAKLRSYHTAIDLENIAQEINNGASYLNVQSRIMVKAPTLKKLDDAIEKLGRLYTDRFSSIWAAPYIGDQRDELKSLLAFNTTKRGKGWYMTSTEFAGNYNLVTHGLEDNAGFYTGVMTGDVNNASNLFDSDGYHHHVAVCTDQYNTSMYGPDHRVRVSSMWGSFIAQSALLNGHRVVHVILDGTNIDDLGPRFDGITYRLNMNQGDVNPFEMFGEMDDELSIFPAQLQKITLMAEQAYETTDTDRSIIRGALQDVLTEFYVDNRMWALNAKENRERLRVVGIPHGEVPKLEMFVTYLEMRYKALVNAISRDDEMLHALSVLLSTFKNLRDNNGDLFNTITSDQVDGTVRGRRVIYDFSKLMMRGIGVAMAQLVNVINLAVQTLGTRDVVIVHGADNIQEGVREYLAWNFDRLYDNGGRVVFTYNNFEKMFDAIEFNHFDKADYLVMGNMTPTIAKRYQELLGQGIPKDLFNLLVSRSEAISYIRRDTDNVVFRQDLRLFGKKQLEAMTAK